LYVSSYFEKDGVEVIANSRIPPHVLKDFPSYYVFDHAKVGQYGGKTLLWDISAEIERRQAEAGK
jgi:hypothetical protein